MRWHLAQVNVGRLRAPVDDPLIADFVAGLDRINALADLAAGFIWRLQTEDGNATAVRPVEDDELLAINMSAWESVEALADYVYRSGHVGRALETFQRLRAVLRGELGVEPCPRLQRLQQAILSGDPTLETAGVPVQTGSEHQHELR